ncbi:MAG: cytochrome c3 family protein [Desulfobacteraceae bacterium]|nr:cytochrome c3 family protein [Desulfobacteraceae bacterium]
MTKDKGEKTHMLQFKLMIVALIIVAICPATAFVAEYEKKGAEKMSLYGGSRGPVPFPHLKHQKALNDCNVCHGVFDQQAGSIEKLKQEGKLVKKQVMNKQCIKCHRTAKKEDKSSGPTSCKKCHIKNNSR